MSQSHIHDAVLIRDSDRSRAAHATMPISSIRPSGGHLASRIATNASVTIPSQYALLESSGRIDNFRKAAGKLEGDAVGRYYDDSDVYKWLEAACWSLATTPKDELRANVDELTDLIVAAQREDGYLSTWFSGSRADQRFRNLRDEHELYCAGHFIQAAIAHHRVLADERLLEAAIRYADLIVEMFGPNEGQMHTTDGHPEIELALIELFRETGDQRYLDEARYFIDVRGTGSIGGSDYHQDATPLRRQREMVGHAVRAVYLNAGATDLVHESIEPDLRRALNSMLNNMVERRSYVTGGIGARYEGEAFGADYELPNNRAYAETCAAIGAVMWAWRLLMLEAKDDSGLADLIERLIYNAILPGVSLDGEEYFYQNALRDEDGSIRRTPWFDCACCPPNIARFLAQLTGYAASATTTREGESDARHDLVWIHQYIAGEYRLRTIGGGEITLQMTTDYPWSGTIKVEVTDLNETGDLTLQMRVPDWAFNASATLNGEALPDAESAPGQYLTIRRSWEIGDEVELTIPMAVRRIVSHPRVANNAGRVALMRGPLVYCIEENDNPVGDVRDIILADEVHVSAARRSELLGDVVVLSTHAVLESPAPAWRRSLYRNLDQVETDAAGRSEVPLHAIPYMLWANRGSGPMTVWLRRYSLQDPLGTHQNLSIPRET